MVDSLLKSSISETKLPAPTYCAQGEDATTSVEDALRSAKGAVFWDIDFFG